MKAAIIREHGPLENVEIATDLPIPKPGRTRCGCVCGPPR